MDEPYLSGARHRLLLCLEDEVSGATIGGLLAGLAEAQLDLRGHIIVDLAVSSKARDESGAPVRVEIEALTVEAG